MWFHEDVHSHLPPADLGCNPFRSYHAQISTTYRRAAAVYLAADPTLPHAGLSEVSHDRRWAVSARVELLTRACREAVARVDVRGGDLYWSAVAAPLVVDVTADPDRPGQLVALTHLVRRRHASGAVCWVAERWDVSGPVPLFAVLAYDGERGLVDVTGDYVPEAAEWDAGYPYHDTAGRPILPYVLYHARMGGDRVFSPYEGIELVSGTLTTSTLLTYWLEGMRDGSFPARALVDGDLSGGTVQSIGGQTQRVLSRVGVLEVRSHAGKSATLASFPSTIDPAGYFEAIQQYVQMLALQAGMSAQDVAVSSSGLSRVAGVAIQVSRAGIERAREEIRPSLEQSDAYMSETAARLWNSYLRPGAVLPLPETADAYGTHYAAEPLSVDELRARLEVVRGLTDSGMIRPDTALAYLHPEWTPARIADELAGLAPAPVQAEPADAAPLALVETPAEVEAPAEVADQPIEPAAALALNGAQVMAASAVLASVASRALPRESGVAMMITLFGLSDDDAEAVMGPTGKTFFAAEESA